MTWYELALKSITAIEAAMKAARRKSKRYSADVAIVTMLHNSGRVENVTLIGREYPTGPQQGTALMIEMYRKGRAEFYDEPNAESTIKTAIAEAGLN